MRDIYSMPPGLDHWITTEPYDYPDPEYRTDEEEAEVREHEDELPPEPEVTEVWIGWPVDYCHRVRFASGSVYSVVQATSGAFIHDFEIHGPGDFYRDGYESAEKAIDWLCDPERRSW